MYQPDTGGLSSAFRKSARPAVHGRHWFLASLFLRAGKPHAQGCTNRWMCRWGIRRLSVVSPGIHVRLWHFPMDTDPRPAEITFKCGFCKYPAYGRLCKKCLWPRCQWSRYSPYGKWNRNEPPPYRLLKYQIFYADTVKPHGQNQHEHGTGSACAVCRQKACFLRF